VSASHLVRREGREIALHEMGGDDTAPLVLVCHATGFSAPCYRRLAEELCGSFHLLGPDFSGHGDSPHDPRASLDWRELADDLLAVIDYCCAAFSKERVFAFGHSMGGALVLHASAKRPGLIQGAYLYEPIVLPDGLEDSGSSLLSESARRRRSSFGSRGEALARYASRPPLDALEAGVLYDYVQHCFVEEKDESVRLKCDPEVEAATFEAPGKPRLSELSSIELRALVGAGGDGGWPASWAPQVAEALGNGELSSHELLGHFGPLESPRLVGRELAEFLERL
jgi:pimeloyl-ACP methyl ester carboxylesterase